tara:strand:+ start:4382 stop:5341 length:960 start_codon:yes stop_codon:yes gene_type:complete
MTPINTIPDCLDNFIGVRCLSTNPKSGLWINDLPGINLGYAADIVDRGGSSGLQFLKEKIDYATRLVIQEVIGMSTPFFRVNSLVDQLQVGVRKISTLTGLTGDKGVYIKTSSGGRLLKIRVTTIKINTSNPSTPVTFKVDDGFSLETYTATTDTAGYAELTIDQLTTGSYVYVTVDAAGLTLNKTEIKAGCGCSSKASKFMSGTGWDGTRTSNTTYGLIVDAVAECSYDEFACIISSRLPFPILFKAGLEIVKEAITTDRLNSITLLDEEKIKFLLIDFNQQYEKSMKTLIDTMPELMKRIDECCIVCTQSKYVVARP